MAISDRVLRPVHRWVWRDPERRAHKLLRFGETETDGGRDLVRAYPSALIGDEPEDLFASAADNWGPEALLAQLGWIRTLGKEGGLFVTVGRRGVLRQNSIRP